MAIEIQGEQVEPLGLGRARIMSSSIQNHWYMVDLTEEEMCQCRGYEIRHACRHVELVMKYDGKWPGFTPDESAGQMQLEVVSETPAGEDVIPFGIKKTVGGYACGEVASALQKDIRRGNEEAALFWATEFDLSGYGAYCWRRLIVICSEDVGPAWVEGPAVIRSLEQSWLDAKKHAGKEAKPGVGMLFLAHAVILLARAKKSRVVDNACMAFYAGDRAAMGMEIPNYALDHHTDRGRRMGRTEASVYDESYRIDNRGEVYDPYAARARELDGAGPTEE